VFEDISKGMVEQMEVEITGMGVLLLVGMAALAEAEMTGKGVLLPVGMVALAGAEITGEVVLLLAGMAALAVAETEITGRAVLLLMAVMALLGETTELAEEGLRQRVTLRMLQSLDGQTLQRGRSEPPLAHVKDEVPTAMMVRLIPCDDRFFSAAYLMLCICFNQGSGVRFPRLLQR
jgi:hypothetical protein